MKQKPKNRTLRNWKESFFWEKNRQSIWTNNDKHITIYSVIRWNWIVCRKKSSSCSYVFLMVRFLTRYFLTFFFMAGRVWNATFLVGRIVQHLVPIHIILAMATRITRFNMRLSSLTASIQQLRWKFPLSVFLIWHLNFNQHSNKHAIFCSGNCGLFLSFYVK